MSNYNDAMSSEGLHEAVGPEEYEKLHVAYDNLNGEYSSLMNRHTDLQAQYDDCAGRIGVDADKLAQTEQMLQVAHDDVAYLKRSLEHKRSEVEIWQARAEGCMAEKDGLLTLIDDIRSKGLKTHKDIKRDEDWDVMGECAMGLMSLAQTVTEAVKPGMTDIEVMRLKMNAAQAIMAIAEKLPQA